MNGKMTRTIFLTALTMALPVLFLASARAGEQTTPTVTGLSDWVLYIDPGHSQTENMGLYGYSEAEKVLRVAHALREMFLEQTDIHAVYMARETDAEFVTLTARVDEANTLGVDFYYSIHSDAGPPGVNSTLMLYGGWKSDGLLMEKSPEGGAAYGEILDTDLTGAMRIGRRGNYADRVFYLGDQHHHDYQHPYLYVNRVTTMASLLSEAGFHTNPGQQMLNLNAEWKVLEALSAFRSFLEWHDTPRPPIGVATGIVRDVETGLPLNDVSVHIGEQAYTTDGFESLFHHYSKDPEQLRNGFYYIDGLEPGNTVEVSFAKKDYDTLNTSLTIRSRPNGSTAENLSFLDAEMISLLPPVVMAAESVSEPEDYLPGTPLSISFSRKMDKESVEAAIRVIPAAALSFSWKNPFVLEINTSGLDFLTSYSIIIDGSLARNSLTGQYLDGNSDGQPGGDFVLNLTTSEEDLDPPVLVEHYPAAGFPARVPRPVIRLVYDEEIVPESIAPDAIVLRADGEKSVVEGKLQHMVVGRRSVVHFFPLQDLVAGQAYRMSIAGGLSDVFGNATREEDFRFYVLDQPVSRSTVIDDFDAAVSGWWHPQQAGQTTGILTEHTSRTHQALVVNHSTESSGAMKLDYAWEKDVAGTPYIRLHLPPTATQNNRRFNREDVLQLYVFGDGSGNEFRMVIRDGLNQLETTHWKPISWTGWKLVSWDLSNDPVEAWFGGNGVLEGANFYMDGFHLRKAEGAAESGSLYFDHLHFVRREEVAFPGSFAEDFQNHDDFTTDIFPWITVDVGQQPTWEPIGFGFPGQGEPFAFKVLNPALTDPPVEDEHPPAEGDKYLIAMQSQTTGNDKWLISPQFRVHELSQLSFYARSFMAGELGPERFRVLVSADDNPAFVFDPGSFETVSEGEYLEAPPTWTAFHFFLGDLAGKVLRFAIHYISDDEHMLMLDNIVLGTASAYALSLESIPAHGGQVSGEGIYATGQQAEVLADPSTGYEFLRWSSQEGEELSTQAAYGFPMPSHDLSLRAEFGLAGYQVNVNVVPEGAGHISGTGMYHYEQEVVLEAATDQEYMFLHWTSRDGELLGEEATYAFSMPASNLVLNAHFQSTVGTPSAVSTGPRVYPNPVTGRLHIQAEEPIVRLVLSGLQGRQLLLANPGKNAFTFDLSGLTPGVYFLEIRTAAGVFYEKIMVNQ